jgi:hypothetical protein
MLHPCEVKYNFLQPCESGRQDSTYQIRLLSPELLNSSNRTNKSGGFKFNKKELRRVKTAQLFYPRISPKNDPKLKHGSRQFWGLIRPIF